MKEVKKVICGLTILSICILSIACSKSSREKVEEVIAENKAIEVAEINRHVDAIYLIPIENAVGVFQNSYSDEVELTLKEPEQMYITGTLVAENGNMGELSDFVIVYQGENILSYNDKATDYQLVVTLLDDDTIEITEYNPASIHGNDVTFNGVWTK